MILPIVKYPNPILNILSEQVVDIAGVQGLAMNLLDTVKSKKALGISAIQVGIPKSVIVVSSDAKNYIVMINPFITFLSDEMEESEEQCLSYMKKVKMTRPKLCKALYTDAGGRVTNTIARGRLKDCILHEYDHLLAKGIWIYDV